jgi:tetratricopeptide (TPR) repeat protein
VGGWILRFGKARLFMQPMIAGRPNGTAEGEGHANRFGPAFRLHGAWTRLLRSPLAVGVAFLFAALLIYSPAINGSPIWDDDYLVGQNPFFRSPIFVGEVFRHYLFVDNPARYYRPVQNISYMLDYGVWAGAPLGYHLTNIFLHGASGFLLFVLLRRIVRGMLPRTGWDDPKSTGLAFCVAMLWTVHPIHNAAVAYISGRADSLASVFALTAWLLCLRLRETSRPGRRWLLGIAAAISILTALCSKELALIWIALFLLHICIFDREWSWRSKAGFIAGAIVVIGIYALLRSLPPAIASATTAAPPLPLANRLLLMLRALGDYTGLIFFPGRLTMDRTLTQSAMYVSGKAWERFVHLEYLSAIGFIALISCIWFCLDRRPGQQLRLFGAAWFASAFLPISNLVPLNAQVAEHWIYLASVGYLLFLAGCILAMPRGAMKLALGIIALAIPVMGIRTAIRAGDWTDPETFCWRTINAGGGTPRICNVLANVYGQRQDYARQERVLRRTVELFPDYALARMNLGACLVKQGRIDEAKLFLEKTTPIAEESAPLPGPNSSLAPLQLAGLRARQGDLHEALRIVREAKKLFPDRWDLTKREAALSTALGDSAGAAKCLERFLDDNWWHAEARLTLAELQLQAGAFATAMTTLRVAEWLDLHNARPYAIKAQVEIARERYDAACDAQRAAIRRNPGEPMQYRVLAAILHKLGRDEEARAAYHKAQALAARKGEPLS